MTKLPSTAIPWNELAGQLSGELTTEQLQRILYATDASVYRTLPRAVVFPRDEADVVATVRFARHHGLSITPRAGGTSLAGQAIGPGIIVDVSRYLTDILEINVEEAYVRVQPGVIRDQLNSALSPLGYWFGPNTSTANRCTLGGMLGNNSCGTTSISVGSTRDHALSVRCVLSDGSLADFGPLQSDQASEKAAELGGDNRLLRDIYAHLYAELSDPAVRKEIEETYPHPAIERRNTGYALDLLARQSPFTPDGPPLNLATLLAGSEGTLAFTTEIKLRILPLPPPGRAIAALHFPEIFDAMAATRSAMDHRPFLCEIMDDVILDAARQNRDQRENSAFIEGRPGGLLLVEFRAATEAAAITLAEQLGKDMAATTNCYHNTVISGAATDRVWSLRAAGLGVLANIPGRKKAVACIEDTAVALDDLDEYIRAFSRLMDSYGQRAVYYAHAGAGEIHLRPILDLKSTEDRQLFHDITRDVALLVKKYRGSLSGEHGDGRVRAGFLPLMVGEDMYNRLRQLKKVWDPDNIFNPGKIIDAPPMNESLRYEAEQADQSFDTALDFSAAGGLLELAEKCNGSGDCRKLSGGTMCPSYRATRREMDSTRGRANALREILTRETDNPFSHPVLAEALDLCLSCKACTSECPSNVDMSSLKAEYLYQRHRTTGVPWRHRLFANIDRVYRLGSYFPALFNLGLRLADPIKGFLGVASARSLPKVTSSLRRYLGGTTVAPHPNTGKARGTVYLFVDEFTDYQDSSIGIATVKLLTRLGYEVRAPRHAASGRAAISKGLLDTARSLASQNVGRFAAVVNDATPLVGIEPSAILTFRDEYPKLLRGEEQLQARKLATNCLTVTEFLYREAMAGRIGPEDFTDEAAKIMLHSHCYEKALGRPAETAFLLSLPSAYTVEEIPSGCCGMAGSFGYEAEHYDVSMRIGEAVLFPAVRSAPAGTYVAATGTSCRHQILDGTQKRAWHPVELLLLALPNTPGQ